MVKTKQLRKTTWYPRPHTEDLFFEMGPRTSSVNDHATMIPFIRYDEGQGSPGSYKANPEHASFAEYKGTGCFPKSEITKFMATITLSRNNLAMSSSLFDNNPLKIGIMIINVSFDDALAKDELSSSEIQDILELQRETTDRQTYPLFNGVDVPNGWTGSDLVNADQPGLTTDTKLEYITVDTDGYYDALQYKTNAGKLKTCQSGITWITLTKQHPVKKFHIFNKSKTKTMVPYGFLGAMILSPASETHYQYGRTNDYSANTPLFSIQSSMRYLEWNEHYDMKDM